MSAGADVVLMQRYTAWANERLYQSLDRADGALADQPRPGRAQGIRGVLGHIQAVGLIWQAQLLGTRHGLSTRQLDPLPALPALRERQRALDQWYLDHALALDAKQAESPIDFRFVDGGAGRMSAAQMLMHVAQHGVYHRGYVAAMLYDAGLKPPVMDLPVFIRDGPAATR